MNDSTIATIVTQIILTVFQLAISALMKRIADRLNSNNHKVFEGYHLKSINVIAWAILLSLLLSVVITYLFIISYVINPSGNETTLIISVLLLSLSCAGFIIYAAKAKKSFSNNFVLPPIKLWQIIFNEIPSSINLYRMHYDIRIVRIVDNQKDLAAIEQKEIELKEAYTSFTINNRHTKLFSITDIENENNNKDVKPPHGIIAFIGSTDEPKKVKDQLFLIANKYPNTPIGYVELGNCTGALSLPYTCLNQNRPEDYVDYLIFRHYTRSGYWKRLCNAYNKCVVGILAIIAAILIVVPIALSYMQINYTDLMTLFFDDMRPSDIKIWKNGNNGMVQCLGFRQNGHTNDKKDSTYLISQVINADNLLLIRTPGKEPYFKAFKRDDDNKIKQLANELPSQIDSAIFKSGQKRLRFNWIRKKNYYDDNDIRVMCSNKGYGVELVFSGNIDSFMTDSLELHDLQQKAFLFVDFLDSYANKHKIFKLHNR